MDLVNNRGASRDPGSIPNMAHLTHLILIDVERKVKGVVQVAGLHSLVRIDPTNESRRTWFKKVGHVIGRQRERESQSGSELMIIAKSNRIYVPKTHSILEDERVQKRLGEQIHTSGMFLHDCLS